MSEITPSNEHDDESTHLKEFIRSLQPDAPNTSEIENTPSSKGEKKREATSPLDSQMDLQEKKTRHNTGKDQPSNLPLAMEEEYYQENITEDSEVLHMHMLSQPLLPSDICQVATELRSIMLPEIRSIVVDAIKEANQSLNNDLKILHLEIKKLQTSNMTLQSENKQLKAENNDLKKRFDAVEGDNDNLKQYSRRNSLRLSGIPEDNEEDTDQLVLQIASSLGVEMVSFDIDRSHRVGRPEGRGQSRRAPGATQRPRDIIVKFTRYKVRSKLYGERRGLRKKATHKSVYINEDLTRSRSKLLFEARALARTKLLRAAYSSDGKLFVRDINDYRHLIKSASDLTKFQQSND